MMNKMILRVVMAAFLISALIACSDDSTTEPAKEFVAADIDFSNWMNWTLTETKTGPDPALGEAHSGNDETVTRRVYMKNPNASKGTNGQYPNGTLVVKETKKDDGTVMMVVAMAKRGAEFNKEHNGWEWFVLDGDKIMDRGAGLMGGMCNACHSAVKSNKDYIFTK